MSARGSRSGRVVEIVLVAALAIAALAPPGAAVAIVLVAVAGWFVMRAGAT